MTTKTKTKKTTYLLEKAQQNKKEFADFLNSYNIVGMAVGVVIGNSVKDLVTSIANNLIMPLIGMVTPSGSYQNIAFTLNGSQFKVGLLVASLLDFLIIALIVFVVVNKIFRIEIKK